MSKKDDEQKAFEEFQAWQKRTQDIYQSLDTVKERMDKTEPIAIPRGYVIAGVIALVALVVAAFPILLFGFALGALASVWISNNWKIK